MSPLYEYECPDGHRHTLLRKYEKRDLIPECPKCTAPTRRIFTAHYRQPDGIYSYAPNVGDPNDFDRRHEAIKAGEKTIKRGSA
jgi:putative FmdB family regulatory protein